MDKPIPHLASYFTAFIILISYVTTTATGESYDYVKSVNRRILWLGKQKVSLIRFYWQDILSGHNPTAVPILHPLNNSATVFGIVTVIDDPLTLGPKLSLKLIGRAQGFYGSASQQDVSLSMSMNFVFSECKYNGSTITVLGRNSALQKVRQMPVIGGSGLFRFARGYVQARTYRFDLKSGDATVEYNVYVMHY